MKGRLLAFISRRGVGGPAPPLVMLLKLAGGDVGGVAGSVRGGRERAE
jgi:hypothetical protein